MPILSPSVDDRHFVYELPTEQHDFNAGDNCSALEIFVLTTLTQSKNPQPLFNSIQERALHATNSIWAELLNIS